MKGLSSQLPRKYTNQFVYLFTYLLRYSHLTEKSKSSVKASQQLHTVMRIKSKEDGVKENDKEGLDLTEQDVDVHEAESVAKAGSPSRVPWSTVAIDERQRLFHDEILEKSLSLASVKEKITGSKILKTEDPKCVYGRVRAEWRFPSSDDKPEPTLPTEKEEMKDRVDRMFR